MTGFAIIATGQVNVLDTLLYNHSFSCILRYFFLHENLILITRSLYGCWIDL